MKDSSTMETRGKARHDHGVKNGSSKQEDPKGALPAKRLKRSSGEESRRSKKSDLDEDLNEPLNGDDSREQDQRRSEQKKGKEEKAEAAVADEDMAEESPDAAAEELPKFVQELKKNVTVEELKIFLKENGLALDPWPSDDKIYEVSADALMFGPCSNCPTCGGVLQYAGQVYGCLGYISEWSRCSYTTTENVRRQEKCEVPSSLKKEFLEEWVKTHDPVPRSLIPEDKFLTGLTLVLVGRMSRSHGEMKEAIEKYGGKVANNVRIGISAIISSERDMEGGGSGRTAEAVEMGIPVLRQDWLEHCIEKAKALPLQRYNMVGEVVGHGQEVPWDQRPPEEEAAESLMAPLKMVGKKGVYADTNLSEMGGKIYEANDIIYNCSFSVCDIIDNINQYAVMQLIEVDGAKTGDGEGQKIYLYFKEGRVGDIRSSQERLELQDSPKAAVEAHENLFEEVTGNGFLGWELENKLAKKPGKYFPLDMAPGVDTRAGGLGERQLGIAASHCKLDSRVVEVLKILFSQTVYRFAMSEMGLDAPDLPTGILTDWHINFCKRILEEFAEALKAEDDEDRRAFMGLDFSNKWWTLLHTTRPKLIENFEQLAEMGAATLESVRDISYASRLMGDLSGNDTLDDPISKCYEKMGCEMISIDRDGDDFKMIEKYMTKTMDPLKEVDGEYNCLLEDIIMLKSGAAPSMEKMMKMPNKVLLWCGMRTSSLVACLSRGMLPAIVEAPGVPGYCFGRGVYCSDAACKAAKYGFTAVDRSDGFLMLAVVSLGEEILELPAPEKDVKEYERSGVGIKLLGKRAPNKEEYFKWKNDITVPCGTLEDSNVEGAIFDYNEYVVYNPSQVMPVFLVRTRFEGVVTTE